MASITTWVAPVQGCNYCHNANNLASDEKYTKVVSRRMLQMTQHINENWQSHVQQTGVTCYTCHRGNNVPEYIWFDEPPRPERMVGGGMATQNRASENTGSSSLPGNPFSTFLVHDDHNIRVQSAGEIFPGNDNRSSIKQTEWTYGLMMHFSNALGINCTGCHNSRSWNDWSQSPQRRATAWYGIRMVRNLNSHWLNPLQPIYPEYRLGEMGDAPKANCMTCHQGAYKPLLGQSMLQDFPSLSRAWPQPKKAEPER
jgi:photosynthetic reaction center cytochrome c subunit